MVKIAEHEASQGHIYNVLQRAGMRADGICGRCGRRVEGNTLDAVLDHLLDDHGEAPFPGDSAPRQYYIPSDEGDIQHWGQWGSTMPVNPFAKDSLPAKLLGPKYEQRWEKQLTDRKPWEGQSQHTRRGVGR